jgi:cytochrome c-type biogenesis protein CcmH
VILFYVICALLIVIALAFVLPPVLQRSDDAEVVLDEERKQANIAIYRDQLSELEADLRNGIIAEDQYAQDRDEIERRLLEDVATPQSKKKAATAAPISALNTAYLLGFGLPLVAIILYSSTYRITHPAPVSEPPSAESSVPPERTQAQIEANVAKLAERLKSSPNDPQGWTMLARSYSSMEKYSDAANAYAKATELNPKDADLWAEYAFVTGMAGGKSLAGKPTDLINRALKVDPENPKALQLAGSAAFQAKDYNKAIDYWQRVLKKVSPNSEVADTINARINEAKSLAASK